VKLEKQFRYKQNQLRCKTAQGHKMTTGDYTFGGGSRTCTD